MENIISELTFEVPEQVHLRLPNLKIRQIDANTQSVGIRTGLSNIYVSQAHLDERAMRIERRLDTADHPAT